MKHFDLGALKFWMVMITIAVVLEAFALVVQSDTPTPTPLPVERREREMRALQEEAPEFLKRITFQYQNNEWLVVWRNKNEQGWNPCFTSIQSFYRPVVKQLPNKKWEIVFETVDLTKEFPEP